MIPTWVRAILSWEEPAISTTFYHSRFLHTILVSPHRIHRRFYIPYVPRLTYISYHSLLFPPCDHLHSFWRYYRHHLPHFTICVCMGSVRFVTYNLDVLFWITFPLCISDHHFIFHSSAFYIFIPFIPLPFYCVRLYSTTHHSAMVPHCVRSYLIPSSPTYRFVVRCSDCHVSSFVVPVGLHVPTVPHFFTYCFHYHYISAPFNTNFTCATYTYLHIPVSLLGSPVLFLPTISPLFQLILHCILPFYVLFRCSYGLHTVTYHLCSSTVPFYILCTLHSVILRFVDSILVRFWMDSPLHRYITFLLYTTMRLVPTVLRLFGCSLIYSGWVHSYSSTTIPRSIRVHGTVRSLPFVSSVPVQFILHLLLCRSRYILRHNFTFHVSLLHFRLRHGGSGSTATSPFVYVSSFVNTASTLSVLYHLHRHIYAVSAIHLTYLTLLYFRNWILFCNFILQFLLFTCTQVLPCFPGFRHRFNRLEFSGLLPATGYRSIPFRFILPIPFRTAPAPPTIPLRRSFSIILPFPFLLHFSFTGRTGTILPFSFCTLFVCRLLPIPTSYHRCSHSNFPFLPFSQTSPYRYLPFTFQDCTTTILTNHHTVSTVHPFYHHYTNYMTVRTFHHSILYFLPPCLFCIPFCITAIMPYHFCHFKLIPFLHFHSYHFTVRTIFYFYSNIRTISYHHISTITLLYNTHTISYTFCINSRRLFYHLITHHHHASHFWTGWLRILH